MSFPAAFSGVPARVIWLRGVLLIAVFTGLLASFKLWLNTRMFPRVPLAPWFPAWPGPWDAVFLVLLLLTLVAAVWFFSLPKDPVENALATSLTHYPNRMDFRSLGGPEAGQEASPICLKFAARRRGVLTASVCQLGYSATVRNALISSTVSRAERPTPIRVAEAKPVQGP